VGGGLAGLTAAHALQEQGREFVLLERRPTLGGLTRTVAVGEFCFDYTGHFLHLIHFPNPSRYPFTGLKNEDWMQVSRRSCRCRALTLLNNLIFLRLFLGYPGTDTTGWRAWRQTVPRNYV
jgi:phytoene dehydrogenase-like protein